MLMRRKQLKEFLDDIMSSIEVVEYTDEGEEGVVYLEDLVKKVIEEYARRAPKTKMKDLQKFVSKFV